MQWCRTCLSEIGGQLYNKLSDFLPNFENVVMEDQLKTVVPNFVSIF